MTNKKEPFGSLLEKLGVKRQSSNFLRYIKELIEELKKSDTVLLLERYLVFKQSVSCHAVLVSASYQLEVYTSN